MDVFRRTTQVHNGPDAGDLRSLRGCYTRYSISLADPRSYTDCHAAVHDRLARETANPDALTDTLSSQLRRCIHALETKQADIVIGTRVRSFTGNSLTYR